ncbi:MULTISPECIES: phage holin family protein [unclassified Serratia (in: enterobacteria)]|uniref:phage holin family protein n=1 Tax=unclassified Serratia (in: enterobacteria) TaxID=2647522 RepID=UPI002ED4A9F6|nr:phage holin family protein [Serratia sp. C2(2)]MEE4445968.1 phage holin family protein [Serratia sp. C2(1)]
MIFKIPEDTQLITWTIIGLVSAWGGLVRYIMDVKNDKAEWRWVGVFFQIVVSGFTGVLGGLLSFEVGSSIYMTCAVAGSFGAMGSSAIDLIANRIFFRNGVK